VTDLNNLLSRIDSAFTSQDEKIKRAQSEQVHEHQERQKRLEAFSQLLDELRDLWRPRLEALIQRFGDRVKVTPSLTPTNRSAVMDFHTSLAQVRLRFSALTDQDVRKLVLDYDLAILPILMKFDSHSELEMPLDAIDREKIAAWIDDRIVSFVQAYLSLHENEYYLKGHMVTDPVAGVRFPRFAAATTLDWQGKTYYFIDDTTRREFEKTNNIPSK
jgi:YHS domain-containing protein